MACLGHQLGPKSVNTFGADVLALNFAVEEPPASADGGTNIRSKKDLYVLDLPAAVRSSATIYFRRLASKSLHSRCQSAGRTPNTERRNCYLRSRRRISPEYNTELEWWSQTGSNRRPEACKATALPTELWPHSLERITKQEAQRPYSLFATPHSLPIWWAWEDSNFRPHAYQARALTN